MTATGTGVDEVRASLEAMEKGTGDFAAVKEAVANARFPARERWDMTSPDRDVMQPADSFERTVTKYVMRKVLSRDQWKELLALWKANPPAGGDGG